MKYKFNKDELYFEVELDKDLGGSVESASARRLIAEDLIKKIIDRANDGIGNDKGKQVKLKSPYSDTYSQSLEFKAFGKKKGDVNLQLTGSMLSSIDILDDDKNKIRIGITGEEAPKSFNHQTGDTVPKRPFLGVTKSDLSEIKNKYSEEIGDKKVFTVNDLLDVQNFTNIFQELKRRGVI